MQILNFLLLPLLCGIIGYFTNYLAIIMLLRPHKQKFFLGYKLPFTPGLIPKRKREIARQLSISVSENLLTNQMLKDAILNENLKNNLELAIDSVYSKIIEDNHTLEEYLNIILGDKKDEAFHNALRYLKSLSTTNTKEEMLNKLPELAVDLDNILKQNKDLDNTLKEMVKKIIDDGFGRIAGTLLYNKVYENLKQNIFEFISQPSNILMLEEKVMTFLNSENSDIYITKLKNTIYDLRLGDLVSKISNKDYVKLKEYLANKGVFILEKCVTYAINKIDIQVLMEDKINSFPEDKIEELIMSVAKRELKYITLMGGVLGFAVGLLIGGIL